MSGFSLHKKIRELDDKVTICFLTTTKNIPAMRPMIISIHTYIHFKTFFQCKTHCISERSTISKGNYTRQQRFTTHLLAPYDVLRYVRNEGMQSLSFQANYVEQ